MTAMAPTLGQIRAQVSTIKSKLPDANTIGIHVTSPWTGANEIQDGDHTYLVDQCDSPLAVRIALRRTCPGTATRVILTRLEENDLTEDIRLRLAKRRLFRINNWQVIQTLFQAHSVDPRVVRQSWMAEQLLSLASADDCPTAPGGFFDLETAWAFLLARGLGITVARPDLPTLLKWSSIPENIQRFKTVDETFRQAAIDWLSKNTDPAARLIFACVMNSSKPDAVPVGIVAQVVFHPKTKGKLDKAAGRIEERYLRGVGVDGELMRKWGAASCEVVRLQYTESTEREQVLKRADEILTKVEAEKYAYLSDVSLIGFDRRLAQLGKAFKEALNGGITERLKGCQEQVVHHFQSKSNSHRIERIEMAMRLLRCLQCTDARGGASHSFREAVTEYLTDGGFIDTARLALRNGDPVAELSESFTAIAKRCTEHQERRAKTFAALLKDWNDAGSKVSEIIPVERVLEEIVAPLSSETPILLVVMDGMSVAVFNQLIEEITSKDWALVRQERHEVAPAAIATIPSVTEFSRTSLFSGKLLAGNSSNETKEFSQHPSLLKQCKSGKPPRLFHKASLYDQEDGGLSQEIRKSIASSDNRIVGVVINAIDDYLLKGDQFEIRWKTDGIRALPTLLHESKLAHRAVVLLSDHGHILEHSTKYVAGDGGDRWREAHGGASDEESLIRGSRVLTDNGECIVPWTENVRYATKKNGYHGGINPQEMIAPLAVLFSEHPVPEGWNETTWPRPSWWSGVSEPKSAAATSGKSGAPKEKFPETLFEWHEQTEAEKAGASGATHPAWIDQLMSSPTFEEQKKRAGRSYPKNQQPIIEVLGVLDQNGFKMTEGAISNSIDYPQIRLRGLIAIMQRVLNLDGYEVLGREEDSDTIELDIALLRKQFELDKIDEH